jgi:hypothetical protein
VKFTPGMISTLLDGMTRRLRELTAAGAPTETDKDAEVRRQADVSTERLFNDLPGAIRRNLAEVQSAEAWAQLVIDDLIKTLQTLSQIARVEAAPG